MYNESNVKPSGVQRDVYLKFLAKLRDVDTPPYTPLQPPTLLNTSIYRALITPFTPKSIDLSIQAHTLIALAIHKWGVEPIRGEKRGRHAFQIVIFRGMLTTDYFNK